RLLTNRCQNPIHICNTTIRVEDRAAIGGIGLIQNCGGDLPLPSCTMDIECPIGSICVNGVCELGCSTSADCTRLGLDGFDCVSGGCISRDNPNNPNYKNPGLSLGAIIGIAVAAVILVVLVSVLCWYFLVYK